MNLFEQLRARQSDGKMPYQKAATVSRKDDETGEEQQWLVEVVVVSLEKEAIAYSLVKFDEEKSKLDFVFASHEELTLVQDATPETWRLLIEAEILERKLDEEDDSDANIDDDEDEDGEE